MRLHDQPSVRSAAIPQSASVCDCRPVQGWGAGGKGAAPAEGPPARQPPPSPGDTAAIVVDVRGRLARLLPAPLLPRPDRVCPCRGQLGGLSLNRRRFCGAAVAFFCGWQVLPLSFFFFSDSTAALVATTALDAFELSHSSHTLLVWKSLPPSVVCVTTGGGQSPWPPPPRTMARPCWRWLADA